MIAIIGAGVAGLATGCYAQMNGYRTRIFEMQEAGPVAVGLVEMCGNAPSIATHLHRPPPVAQSGPSETLGAAVELRRALR